MPIRYKKGDLLKATESVIVHGCNLQGVMGSGVAKAVREKWPEVYEAYRQECMDGRAFLGEILLVPVGDGSQIVGNAYTQKTFGAKGRHVNYGAIAMVFTELNNLYESVAIPKIGAGLGGGDWEIIEEIIELVCYNVDVVVYTLD